MNLFLAAPFPTWFVMGTVVLTVLVPSRQHSTMAELVALPREVNGTFNSISIDPPNECNFPWGSRGATRVVVPLWTIVPNPNVTDVSIMTEPYDYIIPSVDEDGVLRFTFKDEQKLINGPDEVGIQIDLPPDMLQSLYVGGQNRVQIRDGFTHLSNITQGGSSTLRGNLTELLLEGGNDSLFLTISGVWFSKLELEGTATVPAVLKLSGQAYDFQYKGEVMDGDVGGLGGKVLIEGIVRRLDVKDECYIQVSGNGTCEEVYRGMRSFSYCKESSDKIFAEDMGETTTDKEFLRCSAAGPIPGLSQAIMARIALLSSLVTILTFF